MGSGRLPGKVMMHLRGRPMLGHLLDRIALAESVDDIVVAMPDSPENDSIARFCLNEQIAHFRGSEQDNLDRLARALKQQQADIGVVVYGDNPLIDPRIIDEHLKIFQSNPSLDWVGNNLRTTFPSGMEVEVFKFEAIEKANMFDLPLEIREHATLAIRQNPSSFALQNIEARGKRRRSDLAMGIDSIEDVKVVGMILDHFAGQDSFRLEEVIEFLDANPSIADINRRVFRRWRKYRND
jgi:spore coat polysaccharide biosynthesis protein SpsF